MPKAIIETQNYSFRVGGKQILREISLSVRKGESLAIVGPNGAGKSTLLKCLDRILTGGEGRITVDGKPLDEYDQRDLARLISYVPQADGRPLPYTAYEFVKMGRYPHLSPFSPAGNDDHEAVWEALVQTRTQEFAERPLDSLSGGERQQIFIAAALAQGAEIMLLDEPTTFLDPKHQDDIRRVLRQVNSDRGTTVVSASHDINAAALSSTRIVALKDGALVFCGSPWEIMSNEILEPIYEKRFLFVKHPQTGLPVAVPEALEL